MKIDDFKQKAQRSLENCLQKVPFILGVEEVSNLYDKELDIVLNVFVQNEKKPRTFIVETKLNGEPRFARQAVNQLLLSLEGRPDAHGIFIASYISPETAEICKNKNIGYVDLAGNCYISAGFIFLQKEGKPNPYTREQYLKSLYYPKSERILRVLLASGPKQWKVQELANEADVSLGLVSNVKKMLTDREWVDAQTIGFSLVKPFELLESWSGNYSYRRNEVLEFYTMFEIGEFERKLDNVCQNQDIRYGLTGLSGGARYAPAVRYQRVMAFVESEIEETAALLAIKKVESGANVFLLNPYDEGVFYDLQTKGQDKVISPIQVYLDLKSIRGRGEEAAQVLLKQELQKIW